MLAVIDLSGRAPGYPPTNALTQSMIMAVAGVIPLSRAGWVASSNDTVWGAASNAIDGNNSTFWATNGTIPCWLILDMITAKTFDTVYFLPRQDGATDWPGNVSFYVSSDGVSWGSAVGTATWAPNSTLKTASFTVQTARYFKLQIDSIAAGSRIYQGAAEVTMGLYSSVGPSSLYGVDTMTVGNWIYQQGIYMSDDSGGGGNYGFTA